ncbi:MAG: hypothetical protein CVU90_04790 [Firmicutes bacterium HGW-Firmicutes-15]|nr:MAG: hypothetical protein CVU90_04790 [Firmicutes bacterium HGW-Firmicutes-15]
MQLIAIENLRMTGQNMAGADVVFDIDGRPVKAELNFYLQGTQCLAIKLGRHDKGVASSDLEAYLKQSGIEIKKQLKPDIERIRKERRRLVFGEEG